MMSTATFKILYRPVKIGFLIEEGEISDIIKAVELNSMLWGGIYNPIIPIGENDEYTKELIEKFQIDILYAVKDSIKIKKFLEGMPHTKFMRTWFTGNDSIFIKEYGHFAFIDVGSLLDDKDLISSIKKLQTSYYDIQDSTPNANLLKVIFGVYPEMEKSNYEFKKEYCEKLGIIQDSLLSETELGIYYDAISPIRFTGIDLAQYGSLKDHYSLRQNNNSIYIGNSNDFNDLIYFWNLRAYGYNLQYYNIDNPGQFEANINQFISTFDKAEDDSPFHEKISYFYRAVNEKQLELIRPKLKSIPLCYHLHNNYLGLLRFNKPFGFCKLGNQSALVHVNTQDRKFITSFSLPSIPFQNSGNRDISKQYFITSVQPEGEPFYRHTLNIPYIPELNEFFSRSIIGSYRPFELRCQPNGIGIFTNGETKSLTLYPIHFRELILALVKNADMVGQSSQAGLIANKIIAKLGHLDACRVFKIKGVRDLFKKLNVEDAVTRGHIDQVIHDKGNFSKYSDLYIEKRETPNLSKKDVVDFLFKHDFFKAGIEILCKSCKLKNWIPVKRLDDYWECEYCGHNNQLITDLKDRGDWRFRKSGLFGKNNNQEGAIPVILTLLQLYRCLQSISDRHTMIYETAINLINPQKCEMDFCVLNVKHQNDFEIGFGECKDEGGEIDENDFMNLVSIYNQFKDKFYHPYIIISKTADSFTKKEIDLFKSIHGQEIRLILFTNHELEPYYIYEDQFEKEKPRYKYPHSLQDLHWSSVELYLK